MQNTYSGPADQRAAGVAPRGERLQPRQILAKNIQQGSTYTLSRRGFRRGECGEYSPPQLENGGEFSERWGVFLVK